MPPIPPPPAPLEAATDAAVGGVGAPDGALGGGVGVGGAILTGFGLWAILTGFGLWAMLTGTREGVTSVGALTRGTATTLCWLLTVDTMLVAVLTVGVPALGPTLTIWYCPVSVLTRR